MRTDSEWNVGGQERRQQQHRRSIPWGYGCVAALRCARRLRQPELRCSGWGDAGSDGNADGDSLRHAAPEPDRQSRANAGVVAFANDRAWYHANADFNAACHPNPNPHVGIDTPAYCVTSHTAAC